jgi:putative nucleotidyltransferase with HDIG domain
VVTDQRPLLVKRSFIIHFYNFEELNQYIQIFDDYTRQFLDNQDNNEIIVNINLKIKHSKNVYLNAIEIAKSEGLNKADEEIAGICGLFHDIGRFEQFTKYNTFRDQNGIYHGELGVEVLKKEKMLENLPPHFCEIVYTAVYDHGLKSIPKNRSGKKLYFSKLLRDADKADIYRIVAEYYHNQGPRNIALEYGLEDNGEISDNVIQDFLNYRTIDKNHLKTLDDFKCMQIAWIFDINFESTYNKIINNKHPSAIIKSLRDKKQAKIIEQLIKRYNFIIKD